VGAILADSGPDLIGRNCKAVAFADPMRAILANVADVSPEEYRGRVGEVEYRSKMQRLGKFGRDYFHPNFWVDLAAISYPKLRGLGGDPVIVFTDLRYPEEVDFIHKHGGDIWWISRPGCGLVNEHESESHYDYIRSQSDAFILNTGDSVEALSNAIRLRE
jgi:hypothetical protein